MYHCHPPKNGFYIIISLYHIFFIVTYIPKFKHKNTINNHFFTLLSLSHKISINFTLNTKIVQCYSLYFFAIIPDKQ